MPDNPLQPPPPLPPNAHLQFVHIQHATFHTYIVHRDEKITLSCYFVITVNYYVYRIKPVDRHLHS